MAAKLGLQSAKYKYRTIFFFDPMASDDRIVGNVVMPARRTYC